MLIEALTGYFEGRLGNRLACRLTATTDVTMDVMHMQKNVQSFTEHIKYTICEKLAQVIAGLNLMWTVEDPHNRTVRHGIEVDVLVPINAPLPPNVFATPVHLERGHIP